jgi:transglutaminase-like putative cysteine protease
VPYPQELDYQTSVVLVSSDPPGGLIASTATLQRSIYLERMALEGTTVTFQASYRFRTFARLARPVESQVRPYPVGGDSLWREYLESRPPHLDLSDEVLRRTALEIVGETTNALGKVRAIHEWMIANLIYQYAREYSTLDAIARYTLDRRAGDCGQHGMLFIALCRIVGVPARWVSGWEMIDPREGAGMHDWTEVWIEPYGWIPVDTDMAILAVRHNDGGVTPAEARRIADFLLGNLDGHRLTVNLDYGRDLFPPKKDFRSETVDFQRGEVEAEGRNLYFNDWDYSMEIREIRKD